MSLTIFVYSLRNVAKGGLISEFFSLNDIRSNIWQACPKNVVRIVIWHKFLEMEPE